MTLSAFYKKNPGDKIWWTSDIDSIGMVLFSFDRKKVYNAFDDYPYNMSEKEIEIFQKEAPFWANFFRWRLK